MTAAKQKLLFAARWALGLSVLAVLVVTVEGEAVLQAVAAADPAWLAAGLGLTLVVRALHAYQLALAVRHLETAISLRRAFVIVLVTGFYGLVLPGQFASAIVKWHRIRRHSGRGAEALATVAFLRFLNSFVILGLGLLAVLVDGSLMLGGLLRGGLALAAALVGLLLLLSTRRAAAALDRWQQSLLGGAGAGRPALGRALRALRRYRRLSRGQALRLGAVPVATLLLTAVAFAATSRALGLRVPLPSLPWLVALVYFVSLVPATVSGLGLREGALLLLLPRYGVARPDALAFSLVLFGYTLATGLLGGILEAREALRWPPAHAERR
jgi:uncharacterized membrane protein YbhN (UPF0104 family)